MMMSDNGTQMVGAQRELRRMIKGWDIEKLREYCADKGMEWRFTTPAAPHQNGCAEALVKSCKIGLKKAMGNHTLTPFELYTCVLEIAYLVNQRPVVESQMIRMTELIYALMICCWAERPHKFRKDPFVRQETPGRELNSLRRL